MNVFSFQQHLHTSHLCDLSPPTTGKMMSMQKAIATITTHQFSPIFPVFSPESRMTTDIFSYFETLRVPHSNSFPYILTMYTKQYPHTHKKKRHKIFRHEKGSAFMFSCSKTNTFVTSIVYVRQKVFLVLCLFTIIFMTLFAQQCWLWKNGG